jgi:hypothetical protein
MQMPSEHVDQLTTVTKSKAFLGREFLTWLWYVSETSKDPHTVDTDEGEIEYQIWVDDRIVLESGSNNAHQSVMKGGDPSQSGEASVALQSGKMVRELKLGVHLKNLGDFTANLHCDDLSPRSLKLPAPDSDVAVGEGKMDAMPVIMRIKHTQMFLSVLDNLFKRFLDLRTAKDWDNMHVIHIRDWVKQKGSPRRAKQVH